MRIAPLLNIRPGVTALIGGGGKTTLMYTLTEELRSLGSVILCTSTKIRVPEHYRTFSGGDASSLREALAMDSAVCVGTPIPNGKLGPPLLSFDELARLADHVIVEADGSAGMPLKAHAEHEPVIPRCADQTVLILGADGLGQPIRLACHRPELYAALAAVPADAPVTPEAAVRVIRAEGLGDRVLINKAEDEPRMRAAREIAAALFCPVIAGSLHRREYLCLS